MCNDMIDFPVSSWWRDYYYELGLTPHPSPEYYCRPAKVAVPAPVEDDRIEKLAAAVRRLAREVAVLRQQVSRNSPRGKKGWQDGTS